MEKIFQEKKKISRPTYPVIRLVFATSNLVRFISSRVSPKEQFILPDTSKMMERLMFGRPPCFWRPEPSSFEFIPIHKKYSGCARRKIIRNRSGQ